MGGKERAAKEMAMVKIRRATIDDSSGNSTENEINESSPSSSPPQKRTKIATPSPRRRPATSQSNSDDDFDDESNAVKYGLLPKRRFPQTPKMPTRIRNRRTTVTRSGASTKPKATQSPPRPIDTRYLCQLHANHNAVCSLAGVEINYSFVFLLFVFGFIAHSQMSQTQIQPSLTVRLDASIVERWIASQQQQQRQQQTPTMADQAQMQMQRMSVRGGSAAASAPRVATAVQQPQPQPIRKRRQTYMVAKERLQQHKKPKLSATKPRPQQQQSASQPEPQAAITSYRMDNLPSLPELRVNLELMNFDNIRRPTETQAQTRPLSPIQSTPPSPPANNRPAQQSISIADYADAER